MKKVMKFRYRILALLVLAVVLSAATYGFAAANTFDDTVAGSGDELISGYAVTSIHYYLNSTNPAQFDHLTFTLDKDAADVYAGIGFGATIYWTPCTGVGGSTTDFTCPLGSSTVSVEQATALHISAAQ